MEIVALNEELRREFSPVLKLLRPPPASSQPPPRSSGKKHPAVPRSKAPASVKPAESGVAADPVPSSSSSAPSAEVEAEAEVADAYAYADADEDADVLAPAPDMHTATAANVSDLPEKTTRAPQQQLVRIDRFKQHCLTVAHRLNTYQYGTKQAFCQEITQLLLVARTPEQQQELQRLSERVANVQMRAASPVIQVYGSLEFDASASIPGLQEVESDASSASNSAKRWLCNVNIKEHSIPIGTYLTRENALKAYELFRFDRSTSRGGAASVYKLAERLAIGQRESDEKVLQAAMDKCHSHVSWQRLQDMISLSTTPGLSLGGQATGGAAAQHQSRDKEVRDPNHQQNALSTPSKASQRGVSSPSTVSSSHTPLFSPTTGLAPSLSTASSSSTSSTSAKGKNAKKRKKSADRLSHLRLRRLIQKRLCPHLKGKEVCVMRRPESVHLEDKATWAATGRLESGKVFSYKYEKLVTFADYVADGMRNPVSACPHIFLVKTKESIDDHLLVCDTFSDAERLQLGQDFSGSIQNYMKLPEPKASRRR